MPKLLIIGYVWPEPQSSAAGSRMMQLIHFFKDEGFSVCFATTAQETAFMADLEALEIQREAIELNNPNFDSFVEHFGPDVVLFDRFMMEEQFGWRVSEKCPEALKILDTEDLHFLRKARSIASKNGSELTPALLQSDLTKREIASIFRCDLSLIISDAEMQLLQERFQIPEHILYYLPLTERLSPSEAMKCPSYYERKHFVSIGNFLHEPNWNAVQTLKQEIWPLIRKELPEVELHIYGAYPSQKVFQLHNPSEGFLIKGRAVSAEEVLQDARVLLAPLRFGAGIKGKFLDAMKAGTPSVTTAIGVEGMAEPEFWSGLVEEESGPFANAAVQVYSHPELWKQAQENGWKILRDKFIEEIYKASFMERVHELRNGLKFHRENNFIGALLSHHQLSSTRYLAKYIEMKNRLQSVTDKKSAH